jgi:3-oxoacyl-[acyl-carrier protein] reductase
MNLNLIQKNALVGGSSKGIGLAAAKELALLGANVTLMSRSENDLKAAILLLDTQQNQKHTYICVDFAQPDALKTAVEQHVAQNPIHILVNNTGGPPAGAAHTANIAEYLSAFNNHLICNQILVQACVESMKTAAYGRIINVISTSVKQPLDNLGVSNTIRGAVASWAKTLANELGQYNITVNNVLPGATATERLSQIISSDATRNNRSTDTVAANMQATIPLRRFAEPQEVGAVIAFLASPAAAYINGINLPVDGGRTKSL